MGLDGTHDRRLILDLDRPASPLGAEETRCDYLVFIQTLGATMCVVPIELKNGPRANPRCRPTTSRGEACRPPAPRLGDCDLETCPCLSEHAYGSLQGLAPTANTVPQYPELRWPNQVWHGLGQRDPPVRDRRSCRRADGDTENPSTGGDLGTNRRTFAGLWNVCSELSCAWREARSDPRFVRRGSSPSLKSHAHPHATVVPNRATPPNSSVEHYPINAITATANAIIAPPNAVVGSTGKMAHAILADFRNSGMH